MTLGSVWHAHAAPSAGCAAINAHWGSGVTLTNGEELWNHLRYMAPATGGEPGVSVSAGEKINYMVATSGTTDPYRYGNAGFALYKDMGTPDSDDVLVEDYAMPGKELNLSGTYAIDADNAGFVVYAWSNSGTVHATVTCTAAPAAPSITAHPGNVSVAAGVGASFTVVAEDATSYQWQVDEGSGFTNIANDSVYSGATTSTLTISQASVGMNGYLYRIVASGAVSPDAVSNSATLTVTPPPTITGVGPSSGDVAGGTSVTIVGTNLTGATAVTFGGTSASAYTINSATSITATTPAHVSGSVDIVVTTPSGSATLTGAFAYVAPPSIALTPGSGSGALAAATVNIAYSQAIAASGGTAPYSYAVTSGSLPAGLTLNAGTGTISGTPTAGGTVNFTITATDANSATAQASYSIAVGGVPTVGAVSATLNANSSANPITLNLSGGAATSVAVAAAPSHGIASAAGTTISYTPTPGYSGADSFTYTATNASGTSAPATVTVTVWAPTLALSPATGALAGGAIGVAYIQTITASGGTAPYGYEITSGALGAGLSFNTSTGTISGTPMANGIANLTITATDAYGATGSSAYSLTIGGQAPVASAVSATVAANSSANPITLSLSGGAATSVAVASGAAHGNATATNMSITYTPTPGYSGPDSFTYTATNASGTSSLATVTVTVSAPMLAVSPATLPNGSIGMAYSQTITASLGTAPYSYVVTSGALPDGLALNDATGVLAGTPTAGGTANFTVTATDVHGATGAATYTITVAASPAVFAFSPAGGALVEAMAGEDYTSHIIATGGTGALIYSVAGGTLPAGLVLNVSTGALSGPLQAATEGDYSFSIGVRDANGATGSEAFTLKVKARAVVVPDQIVNVPPGSDPLDVYLNGGATGGPFTGAVPTFIEPVNAGIVTIIRGQVAQASAFTAPVGWYLNFKPNRGYSGRVRVGFRLTSALGSNTGTITYNLGYDAADVAENIDARVRGFVGSRQDMIASAIAIPDLMERRRMQAAGAPVTAQMSPSSSGLALGFASSLAQLSGSAMPAGVAASSPFNIWIDGALMAHKRDDNAGDWGSFGMVSLGADYLLSEKALVGVSLHYDRMSDPTDEDALLTGNGWLAGPYASFEFGKGLFWNTSLLYGGSSNDIDTQFWDGTFNTRRWLFDSSLKGQVQLDDITVLTPRLRAVYFSEKVDDYAVRNDVGDEIEIAGFTQDQLRLSLGAEIARTFELANGSTLMPKLGLTAGYTAMDGAGLFGTLSTGLSLQTANDWTIDAGLLFSIEDEGHRSVGAKLGVSNRF